ncbi:unnamed protein product [Rhizophagus irregularis]|nr:unnamed protein product [Rhizophagus irregularis]
MYTCHLSEERILILSFSKKYNDDGEIRSVAYTKEGGSFDNQFIFTDGGSIRERCLTIQEKIAIDELQVKSSYSKKRADIAKKISLNRKERRRTETKVKNYCIVKIATKEKKIMNVLIKKRNFVLQ